MTYLDCSKTEIIASEVGSSKKRKKSIFSIFAVRKELTSLKMTFKARFCLRIESFNCSDDISGGFMTKSVIETTANNLTLSGRPQLISFNLERYLSAAVTFFEDLIQKSDALKR